MNTRPAILPLGTTGGGRNGSGGRGSRLAGPGFTLIELLVVIAVIGILAALLLPVLSSAKQRALRIKCLSNVKQVDLCFIEYAHDNNDRLPYNQWISRELPTLANFAGPWNDVHNGSLGITLRNNYGLNLGIWGCPAHIITDPSSQDYGMNAPYFVAVSNIYIDATNQNIWITQQLIQTKAGGPGGMGAVYAYTDVSRRVLVTDYSITAYPNTNPMLWQTYNWATDGNNFRSDHIDSRKVVTGCNDGMLDGHAQWVRPQDMRPYSSLAYTGMMGTNLVGHTLWW